MDYKDSFEKTKKLTFEDASDKTKALIGKASKKQKNSAAGLLAIALAVVIYYIFDVQSSITKYILCAIAVLIAVMIVINYLPLKIQVYKDTLEITDISKINKSSGYWYGKVYVPELSDSLDAMIYSHDNMAAATGNEAPLEEGAQVKLVKLNKTCYAVPVSLVDED